MLSHITQKENRQDQPRKNPSIMASAPGSSSRPHGPQEGDWHCCLVPHLQLSRLQTQGYLPLADLVSVRAGLASIDNDVMAESFPNPNKEETVCFIPFLLRGLGFPIHPFLRGPLEFMAFNCTTLPWVRLCTSEALLPSASCS